MFLSSLIWFLLGATTYAIGSRVLAIVDASRAFHRLEISTWHMLLTLEEDMDRALELKCKSLGDAGVEESEIQKIKSLDEQFLKDWKDIILIKMIVSCPSSFLKLIKYESWEEARDYFKNQKGGPQ